MLVERGVNELHYSIQRLIGTAPEALSASIRALVALQLDASPKDVGLQVLGVPPGQTVVDWDSVTIGGARASRVLNEPTLRKLTAQFGPLWPPGPHALAHAAAEALSALSGRSRRTLSCFVAPDEASGRRHRVVAVPIRVSESGVKSVQMPPLEGAVKTALESAMAL
jgi:malate/lactate dehydrogenase